MAEKTTVVPETALAAIHADAEETYQHWKTTSTEAQRQKDIAIKIRLKIDEAYKAMRIAKIIEFFKQADANGDGRLDAAEYETYH